MRGTSVVFDSVPSVLCTHETCLVRLSDSNAAAADEAVENVYGAKMSASFNNHGVSVHQVVLPGEEVDPHITYCTTVHASINRKHCNFVCPTTHLSFLP